MFRIMFLTCTMQGGGAERVIANLSDYLVRRDYEVSILATGGEITAYEINEKVSYFCVEPRCSIVGAKQIFKLYDNWSIIKKYAPDVIITFLPTPAIYGALFKLLDRKITLIISERMDPYQDPKSKLLRKIRDFAFKFGDGFVFQTNDAKEYFNKKIQRKSKIILNPLKDNLPYQSDKVKNRIVTAARLEPQKNILLLIRAFEKLDRQDFELYIYGQGSEELMLKRYVEEHHISNVVFKGFSSNVHEEIKEAMIFVLSSSYEGLSNSMLEAMAMGIPLITTDHPIGGPRMLIKNKENGLIVPLDDVDAMASALKELINDVELRNKIGKNAIAIREICSSESIYKEWEEFIIKIRNGKNG